MNTRRESIRPSAIRGGFACLRERDNSRLTAAMLFLVVKFENWLASLPGLMPGSNPRFVVDGQAPMRQCLHPETCNKDIELPERYNYFHDLRKDFVACYSSHGELSTLGVQEMLQCILSCSRCMLRAAQKQACRKKQTLSSTVVVGGDFIAN